MKYSAILEEHIVVRTETEENGHQATIWTLDGRLIAESRKQSPEEHLTSAIEALCDACKFTEAAELRDVGRRLFQLFKDAEAKDVDPTTSKE